jgi:succinate dehydrogenase/fumarate reductase-like Fe-S protein
MSQKNIKVKVFRFDPTVEKEPHDQTYEVPLTEGMNVLDVLDYIYEKIDSSLAYHDHAACRHGICAGCTLVVNGKTSLACQTPVSGDITLGPPPKLEVVKDLVYITT